MHHLFADRIARRISKVKREQGSKACVELVNRVMGYAPPGTEDHEQVLARIEYWKNKPIGDV